MGEGSGRRRPDAPARHGRGKAAQRATVAGSVAAVEEHRRLAVGGRQLKAPSRGLVSRLHLRDDAGQRSIAQAIFGKGQNLGILAALSVEDLVWSQANLLKARRIEVEPRYRPEDDEAGLYGKARRDSGREEGGAGVVVEARRRSSDLVQASAVQPMIGQPLVYLLHPERQHWPARGAGMRQAGAKRGKLIDPVLVEGRGTSGHGRIDSVVPHMFL